MVLAGRVWNSLDSDDRMLLLRHCNTITHEDIKKHETSLLWDKLMPVTQNDLLSLDFCEVLGRDVIP